MINVSIGADPGTKYIIDGGIGAGQALGMARLSRVVVPGIPHHVTQRGNRRQQTFFFDDDYAAYRDQLAESCSTREPSKAAVLWP